MVIIIVEGSKFFDVEFLYFDKEGNVNIVKVLDFMCVKKVVFFVVFGVFILMCFM